MDQFWVDLLVNSVGGLVAALVFAGITKLASRNEHRILKELTEIMGHAIEHRNVGKARKYDDPQVWIQKAKEIERKAVNKAKELSTTAGSLVEWLDKVDPYDSRDEVERYISFLSKIIERIRELMERHS